MLILAISVLSIEQCVYPHAVLNMYRHSELLFCSNRNIFIIATKFERSEKARLSREESYRVLKEKRTTEIVSAFHRTKALWEKKASEDVQHLDKVWQQQERKAKQAESNLRRLVKASREDYKRNSMLQKDGVVRRNPRQSREVFRESAVLLTNVVSAINSSKPLTSREHRPSNITQIEKWFIEEEKPKNCGLKKSGTVEPWFHGIISREDAESLLTDKPVHSFLVRVSEKIWGYAISYKSESRCKHYLVDTTENGYQFLGTNQLEHQSLSQLVHHHKNHPVSTAGQELLLYPVGQIKAPPDYHKLFPELLETTSL
ncbi:SH2D4A [Bugula neritina]|uniref:SH2D4A n=1 Tax=Bugula neritina TaxID=10212 RepID=A0A7J7J2F9_BUGNE|nr:SH2D4A [Bugula neritina]